MCNFYTGTDFDRHDCRYADNADRDSTNLREFFGIGSRCFEGDLKSFDTSHTNMCYKSKCVGNTVEITIGNEIVKCMTSG
jgi:hypothetical protein